MLARADRAALAGLIATSLALLLGPAVLAGGSGSPPLAGAAADVVPYDGRSPREPPAARMRVLVELPRPALGELTGLDARAQRRYVASLKREGRALRSGLAARGMRLRDVVTFQRLFNGFAATVAAGDLVRLAESGLRANPVRRFYPAISEPVELPPGEDPPARVVRPRTRPPVVAVIAGGVATDVLGQVLEAEGARARVLEASDAFARTDELLAALERAVDRDRDGATDDRAAVALVGVNAPYAGFPRSPEARAIAVARRLGMPVVAPAGHEGPGATIGSPGAAPDALTVGALSAPGAVVRIRLTGGLPAALLAGGRPPPLRVSEVVAAEHPDELLRPDAPRLQGALARVRVGANPAAQAAAAAAAGARAVLLAEPRPGRVLPALPAARVRIPVMGVTGEAARRVLGLRAGSSIAASPGDARSGAARLSRFSSRGFAGARAKPDRAARAWVDVQLGGEGRRVAGAGVAAARVAAALAVGRPLPGVRGAPAGATGAPGPPPARLDGVRLTRQRGRVTGVRFSAGLFVRGEPAAARPARVQGVGRLDLRLVDGRGRTVRRLTLPGGEELLPGDYRYLIALEDYDELPPGRYAFRVRAFAPGVDRPTVRRSPTFVKP